VVPLNMVHQGQQGMSDGVDIINSIDLNATDFTA
jgi:hypothetical protein